MGDVVPRSSGCDGVIGRRSTTSSCRPATGTLLDPEAFDQQLAVAMVGIAGARVAKAGRETRTGNRTERACAQRARAGALRAAQAWRPRRSALRLSGVRVASGSGDEVVPTETGMAEAIKQHWLPVFQALGDESDDLLREADAWVKKWDFAGLRVPSEAGVAEITGRGRRTSPGPDGIP